VIFLCLISSECGFGRRFGGRSGGSRSSSGGGWFGSRSSSSRSSSSSSSSGGWFGSRSSSSSRSRSSSSNSASSYPKQQWGSSSGGTNTGSKQPIGGGGFVNPKPASNAGGLGGGNKQPIGGGGFVNPNKNSYGSYGTRYGTGSSFGGTPQYSYKSPGYGTNFGTSFPGGVGKYGGKGFSKKALGLGVGAGFLGGVALGAAGTAATYGVYHRYNQYRYMMMMGGYGYGGYHGYGYHHGHYNTQCFGGCPYAAHCEWGFCECNRGYEKRYGRCEQDWSNQRGRPDNFDPFVECMDSSTCQRMDMNLICNTNLTLQAGGKCECRSDMKWNTQSSECQLYIDVDCSSITYDTKPSPVILEAVNKTLERIAESNKTDTNAAEVIGETTVNATDTDTDNLKSNETISQNPDEALSNSLLTSLDPKKTSEADIKEAFCRDIDSFSFEFAEPQRQRYRPTSSGGSTVGSIIGTVIAILIFFALCCVCCICCAFKGAKDKLSNAFKSSDHGQEAATGAVAFTAIQDAQPGITGYHPNPGFQSQPTPLHKSDLPYSVQPEGPPPIPPTQPGYSNFAPNNSTPYPPNNGAMYPPGGGMPYPPENAAPYPPNGGAPLYPPTTDQSPYPPAYQASSSPYPPAGAQPAYNPTAPP